MFLSWSWRNGTSQQCCWMVPSLFTENPAAAEVAFRADPGYGRRDVGSLNRSVFQAEVVDSDEPSRCAWSRGRARRIRVQAGELRRAAEQRSARTSGVLVRNGSTLVLVRHRSSGVRVRYSTCAEESQAWDHLRPRHGYMFSRKIFFSDKNKSWSKKWGSDNAASSVIQHWVEERGD